MDNKVHDEELALKANPVTLLHLVGKHDWQKFLSYLHQFEPDEEDTIQLV